MEKLLKKLRGNSILLASIEKCEIEVTPILQKFITNFPEFTDHSIVHSKSVLQYAEYLLSTELKKLNDDEVYVLIMAGYLHDVGMCPTTLIKKEIKSSPKFKKSGNNFEDYLRHIHHEVSYEYITTHWKKLGIINKDYAEAIALVGMGHRVVDLTDFQKYNPEFTVKTGNEYVCLPYLAGILRLADELDISNDRTPELLYDEYLPKNRVSKKEWAKHKANYKVNCIKGTITIKSECFKRELYDALLKQYHKIEGVITYVQKLIYDIPRNDRKLKLDFDKLDKKINTVGFIPKEIGFSFDLQNTIETFIGQNIYKNKFVALRECLQNAIDSCRYRRTIVNSDYHPEITVRLQGDKLLISDNGLGMDEFIIKNYFAKLAKSYYAETRISSEFEAISQFGVGVFSYFLLCDYFEVESKMEGKNAIKFRANKNADNYFHFYDTCNRESQGTLITLFIKESMDSEEILKQLKHYLRHVEFPIAFFYNNISYEVQAESFDVGINKFIENRAFRHQLDHIMKLHMVRSTIFAEDFEGTVGLLVSKNDDGTYIPIDEYSIFQTFGVSNFEVSQKGIYVNDIREYNYQVVIGKVNLKKKNSLDLGRYRFQDFKLLGKTVRHFYSDIFTQIFSNWRNVDGFSRVGLTDLLLSRCIDYTTDWELWKTFDAELYYNVYINGKQEAHTIKQICELGKIVLMRSLTPYETNYKLSNDELQLYSNEFKCPIVISSGGNASKFLLDYFHESQCQMTIICHRTHWYYLIDTRSKEDKVNDLIGDKKLLSFDRPHIGAFTGLLIERVFNKNHEIIKHFNGNRKLISQNAVLEKYFDDFFYVLSRFYWDVHDKANYDANSEINHLNNLLTNINSILSTKFILKEGDFPVWINNQIKWS